MSKLVKEFKMNQMGKLDVNIESKRNDLKPCGVGWGGGGQGMQQK